MEKLRKIFGGYEMTWKRLIVFSVICGVYTAAVLLIPYVNESAFKEIGVGYECWFILAIFVVSNCKDMKDAAFKCFVFFLISQPLIYLIQSPFVDANLLESYYRPWFIKTFYTLPGGAIAYLIKRNDIIGSLVLSVAGIFVSFMGACFFVRGVDLFQTSYILYGLFLVCAAVILGLIFCKKKKHLILYIVIILIATLVLGLMFIQTSAAEKVYEMPLTDEGWYVSSGSFDNMSADIEDNVLVITYTRKTSVGKVTLINDKDEEMSLSISVDENEELVITQ